MKRRTFLQMCGLLALAPFWYPRTPPARTAAPQESYDSSGGQWVFDGVNGLTFPAAIIKVPGCWPSATRLVNWRALTFLERLLGGMQ